MDNKEQLKFEHLVAAASTLDNSKSNFSLLQSYFYLQCNEMSSTFKLPKNIFGPNIRCSHCFRSWQNNEVLMKSHISKKKISSSAIKRYKSIIQNKNGKKSISDINSATLIINSKIYVIKCNACGKSTELFCKKHPKTIRNKMNQIYISKINTKQTESVKKNSSLGKKYTEAGRNNQGVDVRLHGSNNSQSYAKKFMKNNTNANLHYQSADLPVENMTPQTSKNINISNKKKKNKDKFAGLCKDACIASKSINIFKKDNPLNILLKQV